MLGPALLPLGLEDGGSLAEAVVIFLGLCAYALPRLIKAFQDRKAERGESTAFEGDEETLPGRRPRRGAPPAGGAFADPKRAARERRREALARWQELLIGEEPKPEPKRPRTVVRAPQPRPPAVEVERPSPTLVELGHSIDELHQALEQRHAELEVTHQGLPGASLGPPALSSAPTEDDFETLVDYAASVGAIAAPSQVERETSRPGSRHAWRQAVVLSELFGRPVALRSPFESPGRLPG